MKAGTQVVLLKPDEIDLRKGMKKGDIFEVNETVHIYGTEAVGVTIVSSTCEFQTAGLYKHQITNLNKPRRAIKDLVKHNIAFNIITNGHNAEIIEKLKEAGCYKYSSSDLKDNSPYIHVEVNKKYMLGFKRQLSNLPLINYTPKSPRTEQKYQLKGGDYYLALSKLVPTSAKSTTDCRDAGIEFTTREAAEKAAVNYKKHKAMYKLAEDLNEGWDPDWDDHSEHKFYIYVNEGIRGRLAIASVFSCCHLSCIYFKSEKTAQKAIKIIKHNRDMFI